MGSSVKINSISIDLEGAAKEIDMVTCDHFSIRGFVAKTRERDYKKCWPFSEESAGLGYQQSHPLDVPKFRWWRCMSCIRDIDADGTNDSGPHSNSRSQSKPNATTVVDEEIERNTNVAGDDVVENEDAYRERSQKDDQRATTSLKEVHPPSMNAPTVRSKRKLASPEQVGNKRSKVTKSSTDISSLKEKQNVDQLAATTVASSEKAVVVEETPPNATKNPRDRRVLRIRDNESSERKNLAISGLQRRKTRRLSELCDIEKKSGEKKESVAGRKRKASPKDDSTSRKSRKAGATSENASKSRGTDQGDGAATDSGSDREPIKGKQKNRRFQVVDEYVVPPRPSQEGVRENDAVPAKTALSTPVHSLVVEKDSGPSPLSAQRPDKKLSLTRKKNNKSEVANVKSSLISSSSGVDEGSQVKPPTGPSINASSQPTQDVLNEKTVGSLLDDRVASEGYVTKPIPQVNDGPVLALPTPDNDHMRSRHAEANSLPEVVSSSKADTGDSLRTGVDAVALRSNTNLIIGSIDSSTQVADQSSVPQKDASGADRKEKAVMVQDHNGALGSQSQEKKDDISMAIVEFTTKTPDEECQANKEEDVSNKQPPQETPYISRNPLLIDLNETYDNGTSLEENNTSRPPKPPCATNAARKVEHFPSGTQRKSIGFLPVSQPYMPSPSRSFRPPQESRASSIGLSGYSSQWLGNVPTLANQNPPPSSYRVSRPFGCSGQPQYREAPSRPIWTSSMVTSQRHQIPFPFPQMDQSTRRSMFSQAPSNENTWNLNFVGGNGNQTSFGSQNGAGVNSFRSVDAFSNERPTSLNLLNRMDPRVSSNTPADHPGNTLFTRRHFPPFNQSRERMELQTGESNKTAYPTKQLTLNPYSNGFAPESSRQSFPNAPPFGTSSLSFPNAQASWSHHHQEITKRDETTAPVYNSHERSLRFTSNLQERLQLLEESKPTRPLLRPRLPENGMTQQRRAVSSSNASALPPRDSSGSIVCSVNRNPADFTLPEPGNVYMLIGEDLKVRRRGPYNKKPRMCKQTEKPAGPAPDNA